MSQHLQPGSHLDADQLVAFAEGALSEHERQESLVHLAECEECRRIVFLAQVPLPISESVATVRHMPLWLSLSPWVYAAAVVLCIVTVFLSLRTWHEGTQAPNSNVAHVSPAPILNDEIASDRKPANTDAPVPQPHSEQPNIRAKDRSVDAVESRRNSANAGFVASSTDERARTFGQTVVSPAAPAAPAPVPPASSARAQQSLPLDGRNFSNLMTLKNGLNAGSERPTNNAPLPPVGGPLTLRIEHGQSSTSSLAQVTGAVLDPSGASVSGATVTLRQATEATPRQVKTDGKGEFTMAAVPAGKYDLQIAAPGFQTVMREVTLQASDLALLTTQLPIGGATQTVTIETAAVPAELTESASVTSTISLSEDNALTMKVSQGKRVLALDSDGVVYLSTNSGKHWKKVKPLWPGRINRIAAAVSGQGFEMTTEADVVWQSQDGAHWRQR
jgi:hypothetical protein